MRKIKPNPNRGRVAPPPTKPGFRLNHDGWTAPCGTTVAFGKVQEFLQNQAA